MGKEYRKKDANELQEYLMFLRRGSRVEAKKGKGAKYNRGREKDKTRKQENEEYPVVAQFGRALDLGSSGRTFKSCLLDQPSET